MLKYLSKLLKGLLLVSINKKNAVLSTSPKGYKLATVYSNISSYKNIFLYQEFNVAHYSLLFVHYYIVSPKM
jgi:hypothetical protein